MTQSQFNSKNGSVLLLVATTFTIASFLIHELYSYDIWWQITIGTDILEHLSIPQVDRYTAAALGRPYHDSHWLFQVLLAISHRLTGIIGVQLFMILIWTITFWAVYSACRKYISREIAALLLFLAAMACIERFLPRPEIITFMMIAVFCLRLQNGQIDGWKNLTILGLLQAVWANCHGLFVIGPFLAGCYLLVALLKGAEGRKEFKQLLFLIGILLIASIATPFTYEGWQYAFLLVNEASPAATEILKSLGELSPVFGEASRSAPAFWFFLVCLVITSGLFVYALSMKRLPLARALIIAGLLAAALTGRRNIVLFVLVSAPFCAEQLSHVRFPASMKNAGVHFILALVILLAAWFPLSGSYYLYMQHPARAGFGVTPSFFPVKLMQFLNKKAFKGQVFNSNFLGGFYLYHRFPEALPLTDGRWEIYDHNQLMKIRRATENPGDWQKIVAEYDLQGLMLGHGSPEAASLLPKIVNSPFWKLVYFDYAASFWLRADQDWGETIDIYQAQLPGEPKRLEDCWLLTDFLDKVGATELQLANLDKAIAFGKKTTQWLEKKGQLELKLKRYTEAENTYARLLQQTPDNFSALNEIAFLKYVKGDGAAAEQFLLRALEIEPNNQDVINNLLRVQGALNSKSEP